MTDFPFDLSDSAPPRDMTQFMSSADPDFSHCASGVQSPVPAPGVIKKSKWTAEEDNLLTDSVQEHGMTNWTLVSHSVPGRSGKQCRERWMNQLCPWLNKENWTPQEDVILVQQQRIYGNVWSQVAHFLPGRSANSVKNRWSWLSRHRARTTSAPGMPLPIPSVACCVDQTAPPDLLWGVEPPAIQRNPAKRMAFSDPSSAPTFLFPAISNIPAPLPVPSFGQSEFLTFEDEVGRGADDFNMFAPPRPRQFEDEICRQFDEWARF
jgi:hypothetical protein